MSALSNELYGPNPRQAAETARSLRQLSTDTTMRRTQPGPPVAWIWAGVAVLAVLLVSVLLWVIQIQPSSTVPSVGRTVPSVVDMTYDQAVEALTEQDLTAKRVDIADPAVPEGNVVRTTPSAETSVAAGQEVTVYVSTGADTAKVPILEGINESEARTALESAGLSLGLVQRKPDPALAAGVVISASVASGTEVAKGTTVNLVVASGTVVIVNYERYPVDVAQRELEATDKQLTVRTQEDPGCPAATPSLVKTQSLSPGEVPIHSEITLTYCSGS
jgi:beta-lactam-binding protein with PASTA domain